MMKGNLSDAARVLVNETDVAAKVVDGEAILINLVSGLYYSTDKVGGLVWSMAAQGASIGRIAEAVTACYEVSLERARADLQGLVKEMINEGLVSVSMEPSATEAAPAVPDAQRQPYEAPKITRFDDMADMFALDPPLPELGTVPTAHS